MKILLVAVNYDPEPTGIAPYVAGLARALRAAGHDTHVVTGVPHYPQWRNYTGFRGWRREEVLDGVPVTRVRHVVPRGGIGLGRLLMELTFAFGVVTSRWGRPDVVLTVSPPLIASAAVIARARLTGVPTVLWSQDLYTRGMAELDSNSSRNSLKVRLAKAVEGAVYRAADGVIAIGERFRSFAVSELGARPDAVHVHGNWSHVTAAEGSEGAAFRQQVGWGERPVFMHSGAMGNKQGLEVVIEAAKLAEQDGSEALFVLTGDGSERARLEQLAGSCRNILFLDPLPDEEFRAALAAADVLLLTEKPGVSEMAIPSKLSTYFVAGRPVLAAVYPLGTAAALIQDAGAGRLVLPGDARALLDAATDLASDPRQAQALGARGQAFAAARLGAEARVRDIGDTLRRIAEHSDPTDRRHTSAGESPEPTEATNSSTVPVATADTTTAQRGAHGKSVSPGS